jgi:hypothetical protein
VRTHAALFPLMLGVCSFGGRDAVLRPVCAPNDAPAVLLEVPASAGEYPRFRLRMTGHVGEYAGKRIEVASPDATGPTAEWCDESGCNVIRSPMPTTADFGGLRGDSSITVQVRSSRPDGTPFSWSGVAVEGRDAGLRVGSPDFRERG